METRILFFGSLKDAAGGSERIMKFTAPLTVETLISQVARDDALLKEALSAPAVRIAVDQRMIDQSDTISAAKEIAFMAPFSGG